MLGDDYSFAYEYGPASGGEAQLALIVLLLFCLYVGVRSHWRK